VFEWEDYRPDAPEDTSWDAVIVGAGMGGSFLGWSLARQGLNVLFLERGLPVSASPSAPRLGRLKRLLWLLWPESVAAELAARGFWNRRITVNRDGRTVAFYAPMGNGPGGSSAVYGAALERLRREDFAAADHTRLDPAPLPNGWPIDYSDFIPYYKKAEDLLCVRGTADPTDPDDDSVLRSPPPLSERDSHFFDAFAGAGLSPYRLHVGIDYKPGCVECQGVLCPMDCKAEGANRALRPALINHKAKLLTGFTVDRLGATGDQIEHVVGRLDGREIKIRARIFVLAAGALNTPLVLLNSISERWPAGVGNDSGMIGRGLMFHASEYFVLWPTRKLDSAGPGRTLSSRATNVVDGLKIGSFQSLGTRIYPSLISEFLAAICERSLPFRIPLLRIGTFVAAIFSGWLFRNAGLFATVVEDFAYHDNRVVPDPSTPSGLRVFYNNTEDLGFRTSVLRNIIRQRLEKLRVLFLSTGDYLNYGHPSGTCRFGESPSTSVLTPENRVHGVGNLYVVDASFFPSCGGTNPSLTIAANALRVADVIGRQ
jgi:choline dehydrogenase-like flavoprotein